MLGKNRGFDLDVITKQVDTQRMLLIRVEGGYM